MKYLWIVALLLLFSTANAQDKTSTCQGRPYVIPVGTYLTCTATFYFHGVCDGLELEKRWTRDSTVPGGRIIPWESQRIYISRFDLVKIPPYPKKRLNPTPQDFYQPHTWFMVGSGAIPDAMLFMGPNETHAHVQWPRENALPVDPDPQNIFNLHGACFGGGAARLFLMISYMVP